MHETVPIAFFIFNRPQLTTRVFQQIQEARPRRLLVVADGPRPSRVQDRELCELTRKIVSTPDWPCELQTQFSDLNLGCRHRLSSGLDWVFAQCEEAIILEDDCLPCPSFFSFCTAMLERYRDNPQIMHVSGNNFQDGRLRGAGSYFFSRYTHSWGWASWRRAWRHYDVNIPAWPDFAKGGGLSPVLQSPQEIEYWTEIFDRTYRGEIDTWDYQWLFTCWRLNGWSIQPNKNLISNIGAGPDATHYKETDHRLGLPTSELGPLIHPAEMALDREADRYAFEEHIRNKPAQKNQRWLRNVRNWLALRTRLKKAVGAKT